MTPSRLFLARERWASAVAGALLPLSFAPFNFYPLAVPLIAVLIFLCDKVEAREAAWRGFYFGFAAFVTGTYWLYISIHVFGRAPVIVAFILMLGLFALMAVYFALSAYCAKWLSGQSRILRWCLIWPAVLTLFEWLRGILFSGFPWLSLGYGQIEGPLSAWAPVAGVYGVSMLTALLAGSALTVFRGLRSDRVVAAALIGVIAISTWLLSGRAWTEPAGADLRISMIQGSISQDRKWLPEQLVPTMQLYRDLTLGLPDTDLVLWPEVAIPSPVFRVQSYLEMVSEEAVARDMQIYLGIQTLDVKRREYRNSLIGLGKHADQYHKRHLVPFGEFFPVPDFARRWMRGAGLPSMDTARGLDNQRPLTLGAIRLAPTICYEDAYGAEQLSFFPEANVLINVSNDAWFGESIAPHQHLQIARMRALETGRYMLRATNTGITAIISPTGNVVDRAPQFEMHVLSGVIQPYGGSTPYIRWGNLPVLLICLVLIGTGGYLARRD
ncbi:MAG: apolipoprotein N-acyltransferase [Gammaproteobacteria bacterium]|nr:apolipoprotein N-acyltransferase [Gammaproteobacteria bacterium]